MDEELNKIHVKIAEVKTGRNNTILKTTLGSCVGICFIWKEKEFYGLAHCLLPEAPEPSTLIGAKYVDQAIPSLMAMMKVTKDDYDKIQAIVVGGGNMMSTKQDLENHIGILNAKQAVKMLKELGIKIIHQETGGTAATHFEIDCRTGSYEVSKIKKHLLGGENGSNK